MTKIGDVYGEWKVISPGSIRNEKRTWNCLCSCGTQAVVYQCHLRSGQSTRCLAHGRRIDCQRTHRSWLAMLSRCLRTTHFAYHRYGGRGIVVCERWKSSYSNFVADMGYRPEGKTLDRIDNSGNYEPSNCRWSTPREQGNNRKGNKWILYQGQKYTVPQLAKLLGIPVATMYSRVTNRKTGEKSAEYVHRTSYRSAHCKESVL
jgi:hypothetical protein